jgi:hypothetical protein
MGSNRTTLGNNGGEGLFTFTAAGQDSGPLLYSVSPIGTPQHNYSLIRACSEFTLGLVGTGQGLQITLYFTTDTATASGQANNWFLVAAPSTEASAMWSNPLINTVGQNVCHFKANALAFRAVSSVIDGMPVPVTGAVTLQMLASF